MKRTKYYDYIDEKIHVLSRRIETGGKLNILHLHMHSENFYVHFFNQLYGLQLENLNATLQNVEAIDLIDHKNKLIYQVSSTSTKQKIESALSKKLLSKYSTYQFKFISISKDASDLRKKTFKNPHGVSFNPKIDIYDPTSIMNNIGGLSVIAQKETYEFIKDELGSEIDLVNLDSNLASIINILAEEDLDNVNVEHESDEFNISKKIDFNDLNTARETIKEYKIYHRKVDSIYTAYDKEGQNKSNSVLASMRREYIKRKGKNSNDNIFEEITEKMIDKIRKSANYVQTPLDELELCVDILIVDSFIRCKIFENPEGYTYATAR